MKPEESYKILVDLVEHHTERLQQFNNINIAIHSLIITAIGYMVYKENTWILPSNLRSIPLLGTFLALVWVAGLKKIRIESGMRYTQLRALERIIRGGLEPEQQIFTEGYRFFLDGYVGTKELKKLRKDSKSFLLLTIGVFFLQLPRGHDKRPLNYPGFLELFQLIAYILLVSYILIFAIPYL